MKIVLNGQPKDLAEGRSVAALLEELGLSKRGGLAVEVNAEVVPRSEHGAVLLKDGDHVEVVTMMAGG